VKQYDPKALHNVLTWVDRPYADDAFDRCRRLAGLLIEEGITAGAIGPHEADRVWSRHILDSVCFAAAGAGTTWLDVGTGAGLPGLPMALCYPELEMTLLDRSGRRLDLVRRWSRILELENVSVVEGDIADYDDRHDTLCFRGSLQLDAARTATRRHATSVGVFGLSHIGRAPPPDADDVEVIVVPRSVLDTGVTLLRITP